MSVQQIGTRLVRNFGNGNQARTVITEVVNGKTFTKVLDNNGDVYLERVKTFLPAINIGDKQVKSRIDVTNERSLLWN